MEIEINQLERNNFVYWLVGGMTIFAMWRPVLVLPIIILLLSGMRIQINKKK